ncbi:hypothetical protein ScPMuIL_004000 [Solemya velum]
MAAPKLPVSKMQSSGKIVNGQDADVGEWPWQVSLLYKSGGSWGLICGGTLISPNRVITAAHCVVGAGASSFRVGVGDYNTARSDDPDEQVIQVTSYKMHEDYDDADIDAGWPGDIAILNLAEDANTASPYIQDIELAADDDNTDNCFITGWGRMNRKKYPDILQETPIDVMSQADCKRLLGQCIHRTWAYLFVGQCIKFLFDSIMQKTTPWTLLWHAA